MILYLQEKNYSFVERKTDIKNCFLFGMMREREENTYEFTKE